MWRCEIDGGWNAAKQNDVFFRQLGHCNCAFITARKIGLWRNNILRRNTIASIDFIVTIIFGTWLKILVRFLFESKQYSLVAIHSRKYLHYISIYAPLFNVLFVQQSVINSAWNTVFSKFLISKFRYLKSVGKAKICWILPKNIFRRCMLNFVIGLCSRYANNSLEHVEYALYIYTLFTYYQIETFKYWRNPETSALIWNLNSYLKFVLFV